MPGRYSERRCRRVAANLAALTVMSGKALRAEWERVHQAPAHAGRIDFDRVWREQKVSSELEAMLVDWAPRLDAALRASVSSRYPTEWFKKEDCWQEVRKHLPAFTDPLPAELVGTAGFGSRVGGASPPAGLGAADYDRIAQCM